MIHVLDYGAGNVGSVTRMIEHVGGQSRRVSDPASLVDAMKIVLPGVGAFDHGMSLLRMDIMITIGEILCLRALQAITGSMFLRLLI